MYSNCGPNPKSSHKLHYFQKLFARDVLTNFLNSQQLVSVSVRFLVNLSAVEVRLSQMERTPAPMFSLKVFEIYRLTLLWNLWEKLPLYFVSTTLASWFSWCLYPAGIYLFQVNNGNTRTMYEICLKLAFKTFKVSLFLTWNIFLTLFRCFHCWV